MTKAIFTVKAGSGYDDRPEEFYHFPATYLNQVRRAVGDHIIYYEPRRSDASSSGRQSYFATARVTEIVEDRKLEGHYYALVADYLDFDRPVPFSEGEHYYESILKRQDGKTNKGAFGRAVREVPDDQFDLILKAGFSTELAPFEEKELSASGFEEAQLEFVRPIVEMTVSRPFRDVAFKRSVRHAYGNRCAVTGLKLINGGGRPEVQAAHIKPVASNGPDSVRNGLALSGTCHWMFDRGLISVADDYSILVSDKLPEQARALLNTSGKLILPDDQSRYPNPYYLEFHRSCVFKA
ncbi:HNH endonuclease [Pseudorhodoplanes sp.]|uniref:HNH endonuclease n=1 Tax=Pseudorhodoplanes sp. TaxID=1934341 RepID=UPI002C38C863|nr:HNH endonuclease [Pseudorhodoplanes sp.]HWV51224.1 HNH endonuclease [Pseudorhodoplanes sp.]